MLKILYAGLQHYNNQELLDVQAGFRKGRGTRHQIANIYWITEKAREFQKKTYLCFIDYTKVYNYVDDNELWKTKSWEYQTNSLVSWEACMPVKKQQLEPYMGQLIGSGLRKEYDKAVYWHSVYFNLYAEHIIRNSGLDELQAGIKISGRHTNNLRYAEDTTLMAERKRGTKDPLDEGEG